MAVVNYSFQKNLKEQARKKKQEEKRLLKLNKKMSKLKESSEPVINQDGNKGDGSIFH
ncbi:MAG: hypothetical protein Q8N80_03230 [Candidatus Omnitrophota bacterium]|nr:hypothetical protein [Candidatus Omnitrophota bacterium]